jgi:hypothetical protein
MRRPTGNAPALNAIRYSEFVMGKALMRLAVKSGCEMQSGVPEPVASAHDATDELQSCAPWLTWARHVLQPVFMPASRLAACFSASQTGP